VQSQYRVLCRYNCWCWSDIEGLQMIEETVSKFEVYRADLHQFLLH
jgi:hypothetical protein